MEEQGRCTRRRRVHVIEDGFTSDGGGASQVSGRVRGHLWMNSLSRGHLRGGDP